MSQIRLSEGTVPSSPSAGNRIIFASSDGIYAVDSAGGTTKFGAAGGGAAIGFSGSNGSFSASTVTFGNLNGVSFYTSNGSIVASYTDGGGGGGVAQAAGTQTATSGTVVFANSNGLTFGMSGSTQITASHNGLTTQTVQTQSNVQGISAGTQVGRTGDIVFADSNGITFGLSGSSRITASYTVPSLAGLLSAINVSAGTTSNNLSALTFSNSNGLTFGLNGSVVTASHNGVTTAALSNHSHGNPQLNLTNLSGTTASNSAGFTLSLSAAAPGGGGAALSAGTQSVSTGTVAFANSNGISFGMSNSNQITASYTVPSTAGLLSAVNVSAGTTSNNLSALTFNNANGITFGLNASTITASHNGLTTARASNDGVGLATALTAGPLAWTVNSAGISLNAGSAAGTGSGFTGNLLSATITHNTAGLSLSFNHPAWLTTAAQSNHSHGNPQLNLTNLSGTTASNSAGFTLSLSAAAPGGGGAVNFSAGTTSNNLQTIVFSNSNGVSFGLNGSTMTASAAAGGGGSTISFYHIVKNTGMSNASYAIGTTTSSPVSLFPISIESAVSAGIMNIIVSMNFTTLGTSSGRRTIGLYAGLYTRGTDTNSTTIGSVVTQSFSIGITGNNSTYTINQPTSTDYTGYVTGSTTSAGSNISSLYTGNKVIGFPLNILLTPGEYWAGFLATFSSSSVNVGVLMSLYGAQAPSQMASAAPIGSASSAYSRDPSYIAGFNPGHGSWSSAGSVTALPASMAFTSVSKANSAIPYMVLWRT